VTVKGDRTARESPLLAAELNIDAPPPGWYEIGIAGAGLRAVGLSLPGVPGIVAGHNGVVAWSFHARPGEPLDPAGSVAALLGAAGASEASTILERKVELAGCAADTGGVTVVLAPSRGIPLGAVLVSGASALTAQVMDATVDAGRGIDVEGLRLVLGDASPGVAAARIVIDLGDLDASRAALSTGQSGHPAAFHYRDQAQLWTTGQLHRLAWTGDAVARTEGRLVLRPR
jgi:acyl-homoserine lactone acylase PvdQ